MDPHLTCTCLRLGAMELLQRWQARAMPVASRLCFHGHGVDSERMDATIALIMAMEKGPEGAPGCFSDENRHRSHHLPDCPWAWRNRGAKASPEQVMLTRASIAQYKAEAFKTWAAGYAVAVNRWFRSPAAGPAQATG